MALWDDFDLNNYSGSGGLVDRLLASLGQQSQYQPSAGFPQSPMDANASVPAAPQNAPIAVGNYMMPRIGAGFSPPQIDPQTGETVAPQAQPPQMQQPQLPGIQPAPQSPLMAGLQSWANTPVGNPMAALANGIAGFTSGQRTDASGVAQQSLKAQYDALVPLVGEQKARLAILSPEAAKVILPEALSNHQKFVQMKDAMGAEHPAFVDETNQTVNGKPVSALPTPDTNSVLGDMTKTGKEYLATIPVAQRGTVQGMVEGTIPPPSSFALTKPYWQNMIAAAKNVDPTFDAANWSGRVSGVKDFSAGKSSEMVRSANQTIGHVSDLIDKMDALQNGSFPLKNAVGNYLNSQTGGAAVTGFKQTAHAVADELSKVFKGAGISDHEIKQWEENLSENMSPAQQKEAVTTAVGLLQHSLSALEEKRLNSIGPVAAEKAGPLLKGDAQAGLERIQKWADGNGGGQMKTKTGVKWSVE